MKKIIIAASVIVAAGIIAPKFTGNSINQSVDSFIANINQAPGYLASVKSREINWFSSSVIINVGFDSGMFADSGLNAEQMEMFNDLNVELNFSAQHGPILTRDGISIGLSSWEVRTIDSTLRKVLSFDENKAFYSVTGNIDLSGNVNFEDHIPAFSIILEDGVEGTSAFSGWNGNGAVSANRLSYVGEVDSFTMSNDAMNIEVKSAKWDSLIDASWDSVLQGEFYDSVTSFTLNNINFEMPMLNTKANLQNLAVDVQSTKSDDGGLMGLNIDYAVKSIDVPDFKANDLVMKMEVNNLEKELFKAYREASAKPLEMQQALANIIKNKLLPQLQASPEFNITEMSGKIAGGSFSGKALTKLTGIDSLPDTLEDVSFWISKAVIDSQLSVDQPLAKWIGQQVVINQIKANPDAQDMTEDDIIALASQQVDGMLNTFSQQGMIIVTKDGDYEMSFTIKDGQALLNGNSMPLPF